MVKRGPSKCIKHPIKLKRKQNKLSSTHLVTAIACNNNLGIRVITLLTGGILLNETKTKNGPLFELTTS